MVLHRYRRDPAWAGRRWGGSGGMFTSDLSSAVRVLGGVCDIGDMRILYSTDITESV